MTGIASVGDGRAVHVDSLCFVHEHQFELVLDIWRKRNQGAEPSVENRQEIKSVLDDMARVYSEQNDGKLPDDAHVRMWFQIPEADSTSFVQGESQWVAQVLKAAADGATSTKSPDNVMATAADIIAKRKPQAEGQQDQFVHLDILLAEKHRLTLLASAVESRVAELDSTIEKITIENRSEGPKLQDRSQTNPIFACTLFGCMLSGCMLFLAWCVLSWF
eukprot:COSAG02_NODE_8829_length_2429_cov_2.248498_3_plen_219_part_00